MRNVTGRSGNVRGRSGNVTGRSEKHKIAKKGLKGVKIEKSFLVPYTTHIGLPKSEKKFFWFTITLKERNLSDY